MKLSLHTIAFHSFPIEYSIRKVAELGYEGIELNAETNWALPHITPETPHEKRREVRRSIKESGLEVSSICAHTSLIDPKRERRKVSLDFVKGCIDMAPEFGTSVVHAISGALEKGLPRRVACEWLVESVGQLIDYSRTRRIKFAFEAAVNQLVATSKDLEELTRVVGKKGLFINFDPSHSVLYNEDPAKLVRTYGKRIVHVHAKDSRGTPEHFEFPPLGMGDVDFGKIIEALSDVGYDGYISIEYEGELFGYENDPVVAALRSRDFLSRLIVP